MTPRYCDNPGLIRMNVNTVSVTKSTLTLSEKMIISESDSPVESCKSQQSSGHGLCQGEAGRGCYTHFSLVSAFYSSEREPENRERAVNSDSDMQWQ